MHDAFAIDRLLVFRDESHFFKASTEINNRGLELMLEQNPTPLALCANVAMRALSTAQGSSTTFVLLLVIPQFTSPVDLR